MNHFVRIVLAAVAISIVHPAAALDVTSFGAVPNDGEDDTEAFLEAFRQAQNECDNMIVIPEGRYNLRADGNPKSHSTLFPASNVNGLTIDGQGAELMMSGKGGVFSFSECQNIVVRGLTFDWDRPPFSQGTVVASESNSFDVQIESNYPVEGEEPVGAFMSYDPVTRLPAGKGLDVYNGVDKTELIAPQVLRVHLNRPISVPVGTLLVLRHQVYGPNIFCFERCTNVLVNNVTVYCAAGMVLTGRVSTDISLKHFNVLIRPDSGRLMSATADATHFGGCKGTVSLEDCTFEGMGDDGVNIKSGLYLIVRKRLDDHSVLGQHNLKMVDLPDEGDVMEMSHMDTLLPFSSDKVKTAEMDLGEDNLHRISFTKELPAELRVGDVLGNASRVAKLRMKNCTVRGNRARGVLCQTRDAVIEGCTFRNCTSAGALVVTETSYFHESIGTRNVTVRGNLFENCNLGAAAAEGALSALAWLPHNAYPTKPGVHRDVVFENNRIINTGESAIFAVGVDGLTIRGNTIEHACETPNKESGRNAIRVMNSARVEIKDNTIDPKQQGPGMTEAVRVTDSSP